MQQPIYPLPPGGAPISPMGAPSAGAPVYMPGQGPPPAAPSELEQGGAAEPAAPPQKGKRYILCDTCCGCCCAITGAVILIIAIAILALFFNTWPATQFTNVKYAGPDGVELHAYVAKPKGLAAGSKAPAAIVFHAWNGMSEEPTYFADQLAEQGYYAIAPDLFRNMASAETNIIRNIINVVNAPQSRMDADADAALAYLRKQDEVDLDRIVSGPGFCFGGAQSLVFASRHETAGTVTCYGTYITELADRTSNAWGKIGSNDSPVLGIYGEEDTRPSPKQAQAFEKALDARSVPHNVTIFAGVGHAFINPEAHRKTGHEGHKQAVDAWKEILAFFQLVSRSPPPSSRARRARGLGTSLLAGAQSGPEGSHWNSAANERRSLYHRSVCAFKCALDVLRGTGHFHHVGLPTFGLEKLLASV